MSFSPKKMKDYVVDVIDPKANVIVVRLNVFVADVRIIGII